MGAHRYWRLFSLDNVNSDAATSIAELELRATVGGADQCTGGTPSSSTLYSESYPASQAFDNNDATVWAGLGRHNQWLAYDFGTAVTVQQYAIRCSPSFPQEAPAAFRLEFSDDGSTWEIRDARYRADWTAGEQKVFALSPQPWMLYVTESSNGTNIISSAEVELRDSEDVDLCTTGEAGSADRPFSSSYPPGNAFDNNNSTVWAVVGLGVGRLLWLPTSAFSEMPESYTIRASPSFPLEAPKTWTLRYFDTSTDTWITVDTQTDQPEWSAGEQRIYTINFGKGWKICGVLDPAKVCGVSLPAKGAGV